MNERIENEMSEAAHKAIDSLSRYKFVMFGYWAGVWVHLNRISGYHHPNPFADFVALAKIGRKKSPPYLGPVLTITGNAKKITKLINRALKKVAEDG